MNRKTTFVHRTPCLELASKALLVLVTLLAGCAGESGTLRVGISGEEAAISGFPVEDGPAFVDGWAVRFDSVLVVIQSFELLGADGERAAIDVEPVLVELSGADQALWTLDAVGARRWEDVRYRIGPAVEEARDVGAVDPAARARMIDRGLAVLVRGEATRGATTRQLELAIAQDVLNRDCVAGDGTDGVVIPSGATVDGQITIHLDHLFFDSLRLDEAAMRFDAMDATADAAGSVNLDTLQAQRLADLRDADGEPLVDGEGAPIVYDPGSLALPEPTLDHMVRAAATTMGHWQGEGHCDYDVR